MMRNASLLSFSGLSAGIVVLLLSGSAPASAAKEQVLYSFQGGSDGAEPLATMIADKSGNLYGTTNMAGRGDCVSGCGTVARRWVRASVVATP